VSERGEVRNVGVDLAWVTRSVFRDPDYEEC
jgi:hypothetical protein